MVTLKSHNEETYKKITEMFKTSRRVCAVQPTGTGKSFLILKLIEDAPEKLFLIAAPNTYVFGQIKDHARASGVSLENCKFMTYTSIYELASPEALQCDYLILDEFHRLGAQKWNEGITRFLSCHEQCRVLGTSATPIRYLDSMRDMARELFSSNYAVNMSLAEAIDRQILPLPVYVTTLFNFSGELEELERKAAKTENPRLRLFLAGKVQKAKTMISTLDCGLETVLERHIKNKSGKYIVFCPDTEKLREIYESCTDWFFKINRSIHKYCVYNTNRSSQTEFDAFAADNDGGALKLLFCIDMLNEGIHVESIDGVIMLRPTQSANVFYQQLGRALSCSPKSPVIFDIVNNFETGDTAKQYEQIMLSERRSRSPSEMEIEFEIYDYVRDIRDILNELKNTFESPWEFTYDTLCRYVSKNGGFPSRETVFEGLRIGAWCSAQRYQHNNGILSEERTEKLERIGFVWNKREERWLQNFNAMKQYIQAHGAPPDKTSAANDSEAHTLYVWRISQRNSFLSGNLTARQIKLLNDIGISFSPETSKEKWLRKYKALKKYLDEYGKYPTRTDAKSDNNARIIFSWVNGLREQYKNGQLSEEKIRLLEKISFVWDPKAELWQTNFELLCSYCRENGRTPSCKTKINGKAVGQWYHKLVRKYARGELDEGIVEKFAEKRIPLTADKQDIASRNWLKCYYAFREYYSLFHTLPSEKEMYNGASIGCWYFNALKAYEQGELKPKRMEMMRELTLAV